MTKVSTIVIVVFLSVAVLFSLLFYTLPSLRCHTILPIAESNNLIASLDADAYKFASTSKDLFGRSAEGGEQINFVDNGTTKIIEQRFYAETGKSYIRFYYANGTVFAITKLNVTYKMPIYEEPIPTIVSKQKKDFYVDSTGKTCDWFLDDKPQIIDKGTVDTVQKYLSGIL